jgi:plasmid replication initiation protein
MLRTIITPKKNAILIDLPDHLVGRKVEVIAFAIDEEVENNLNEEEKKEVLKPSKMRGFLSPKSAEALKLHTEKSRSEWDT